MIKVMVSLLMSGVMITVNVAIIRYLENCDSCIIRVMEAIPWYVLTLLGPILFLILAAIILTDVIIVMLPIVIFAAKLAGDE